MATDSDGELVAAVEDGDDDAWAVLWRRHYRGVRAHAAELLGDAHAGEDVASEVLIRTMSRIREHRPPENLAAYLRTAARNRAIDVVRGRRRDARLVEVLGTTQPTAYDDVPSERPDPENSAVLRRALGELSERQRLVLVRIGIEEASVPEVADELGLTPNAVHQLVFRARRRLREELARQLRE